MTLAIDTAGAACSAALVAGDAVVDQRHEIVGRGHAERLIPMIAELLRDRRPGRIAVDCGPGSFTGVRVGVAAARALGFGWGVAVSGFSSTVLIAACAFQQSEADRVGVAIAGGHGQFFVECFRRSAPGSLAPVSLAPLRSLYPEDAASTCRELPLLAGPGTEMLAALGLREVPQLVVTPSAADLRLLQAADFALPPRPVYGRAPDARPQQQGLK